MADVKLEDLLWGTSNRPTRGPKPSLGLDDLVRVGIEVADAEGLPAVTMRRVATELGFTTMALYRHVPGKHELVQLMIDAAISAPEPTSPSDDWRAGLVDWALEYYRAMSAHPWLLGPETIGATVGPNRAAFIERGLRALASTGIPGAEMMAILLTLTGYVHGAAQVFLTTERSAVEHGIDDAEYGAVMGRSLAKVVTADRFPVLAQVLAEGAFEIPEEHELQDFRFGLDRVLDGIGSYLDGLATPPPSRAPRS